MKLFAGQSADVSVSFVNANGNNANVEGDVSWSSSDPETVEVLRQSDSRFATLNAGPSAGSAIITASADADLGAGVTTVTATLEVLVIARGQAIGGEISPVMPSNSLPSTPITPDNSLPGSPPSIDNSLPDLPITPDNELPEPEAKPK